MRGLTENTAAISQPIFGPRRIRGRDGLPRVRICVAEGRGTNLHQFVIGHLQPWPKVKRRKLGFALDTLLHDVKMRSHRRHRPRPY
jgi:hypothetical protein